MAVARYTFCLDLTEDAPTIQWLESLPAGTRSRAIAIALRAWTERPTHQELDVKLDRVIDAIRRIQFVQGPGIPEPADGDAEPAGARRGLERMKERFRSG